MAFKALLERYYVPVQRLISSILGSRLSADTDDVMQEVFVRMHRALPSFRAESKFSTWLYRIVYNHSLNHKARAARRRMNVGMARLANLASNESDPAAGLDLTQLRTVLDMAIDRLATEYQVAVRLYYWFHLPVGEVAAISACSENTVKSYLRRARKLLAVDLMRQKENI